MTARIEQTAVASMTARKRVEDDGGALKIPRALALRCGAMLVDYTILVGMIALATLLARFFGGGAVWRATPPWRLDIWPRPAGVLTSWCFRAHRAYARQWATGLHIEKRAASLDFGRAILRHLLGYPLSLITLGIGFLLAAFDSEGRALHDRIAGTIVVRDRSRARRSRGSSSSGMTAAR